MTRIDGDPGRWRTWLPGVAQQPANELATQRGVTVPQLLASLIAEAHENAAAAGASPAGAVDGGQGATRPPAPTIAPLYRHPIAHIHHSSRTCVYGDRCGR